MVRQSVTPTPPPKAVCLQLVRSWRSGGGWCCTVLGHGSNLTVVPRFRWMNLHQLPANPRRAAKLATLGNTADAQPFSASLLISAAISRPRPAAACWYLIAA